MKNLKLLAAFAATLALSPAVFGASRDGGYEESKGPEETAMADASVPKTSTTPLLQLPGAILSTIASFLTTKEANSFRHSCRTCYLEIPNPESSGHWCKKEGRCPIWEGKSWLHLAIANGNTHLLEILLSLPDDIRYRYLMKQDRFGRTALGFAYHKDTFNILFNAFPADRKLLDYFKIASKEGWNAFHVASWNNVHHKVHILLAALDNENDRLDLVSQKTRSYRGLTALHLTKDTTTASIILSSFSNPKNRLRLLMIENDNGHTALQYAIQQYQSAEIISFLRNAEVQARAEIAALEALRAPGPLMICDG